MEEEWVWWTVLGESSYEKVPYETDIEYRNPDFDKYLTVEDLRDGNHPMIRSSIGCYFYFDHHDQEVFYIDSQGCLTWGLDSKTGQVYIWNPDLVWTKQWVAKSLHEFLSRIDWESKKWYNPSL